MQYKSATPMKLNRIIALWHLTFPLQLHHPSFSPEGEEAALYTIAKHFIFLIFVCSLINNKAHTL
jgi:hypothetical protein